MVLEKKLFQYQEYKAGVEKGHGYEAVMMFAVAMPERIGSNSQCQHDHADLKSQVMDDIDPEQWQAAEKQGQEGTMNGAGQ